MAYEFATIEKKWRQRWEDTGLYRSEIDSCRPKHYALTMLPYTSGDLHIGHWYAIAPSDVRARYMRMKGHNVLFPIGFDAFGLPAENAAIQRGIHPAKWTLDNVERMREQLKTMGAMFDWTREAITCLPEYYRWTQWLFLKFYANGLAYREKAPVDWCPQCNTTLAREQVWGEDRHCERCDTPVIKKDLDQWLFRITRYAEELLDFSEIVWPDRVQTMQENWIGRSEGVEFEMRVKNSESSFRAFTTRPDTIFGMSFAVLAPEHPLVDEITAPDQREVVKAYCAKASRQSEIERLSADKEQDGVFTGAYAINPMNNADVPIYIADYVLLQYGTGAIMAVPAHDERDFDFAKKYGLSIPVVIAPDDWDGGALTEPYTDAGRMVNSGQFDGLSSQDGKDAVADDLESRGIGEQKVNYRLHDWLISRQRYWGCPIPIIYCDTCGIIPVPEHDLPVMLPDDAEFLPTGESPLKYHEGFLHTTCPKCGASAQRETDTMDTFMCSSWYQYRYLSPHYDTGPFEPHEGEYWLPVDQYTGGIEHATMHLLYTRFFTKAMRDMDLVSDDEPMTRLFNQGIILGEDRERMSKSRGNVVNPDDLIVQYGTDCIRAYVMFLGRWEQGGPWNSSSLEGIPRFLNRVWRLVVEDVAQRQGDPTQESQDNLRRLTHQTIRKVSEDFETFGFNTALAALMTFSNGLSAVQNTPVVHTEAWKEAVETLVLLLAPITPHLSEELWSHIGGEYSVHQQNWPEWDENLARPATIEMPVQVNGKVRARMEVEVDAGQEEIESIALEQPNVQVHVQDQTPKKIIVIPNRLVNIVV
ncbi:MAG: leucine--tRNA ligase [Gemmatimonadetes bacterium]|nr:leucine--tRNA ligase [Gemmatimonadota bacterium]MYB56117.1 leucine--tRNA ligase [Gemmatimonadota bacterium]